MMTNQKKKMVLVGIAGTSNDFLLSLHTLKCFVYKDIEIKNNLDIILRQYYHISPENLKKKTLEILDDIEKLNPDIVGFSCYVWNIDAVKIISNNLKQKFKDIKIILGGPEITREDIVSGKLKDFSSDFFIFGEAEKPLLALLKFQIGLESAGIEDIKGLSYKEDGLFFCNNESDFIDNLEDTPSPYLEGCVSDDILLRPNIRVNIETQRGCNFKCAYCFYHKNFPRIRYRNPEVVINEIDFAYKKGIKIGRIVDANFLSDKEFAKKIIRGLIEHRIKMSLFFEILPQFLDEEIAHLFGEYRRISPENRLRIGMGIQTINQEALKVIRRQIPIRCFEKAFDLLQKEEIIIKSDIILGLPLETKESYFKTLEFIIEKMRYGTNNLSLAHLRILPGTDLVEISKKENLTIDGRDSSHFVYETPSMPRKDMLECLRLNAVAYRLFTTHDFKERMKIRDMYFNVKDTLGISDIELMQYLVKEFSEFLKDKNSEFCHSDFPDAESYYEKKIHGHITNEWLIEKFEQLKSEGIDSNKKIRIFIEGAGTATCISVLKGLVEQKDHEYYVVASDMDDFVAGRYFAHKFYKTISSKDENYVNHVLNICEKEKIDIYIPIMDYGFESLSKNKSLFKNQGVYIMIADYDSIGICADKYKTYEFFKENNVPTPETMINIDSSKTPLKFPLIIKPRFGGRATIDVHKIDSYDEFRFYTKDNDNYVIQDFIDGKEFTADCLNSLDGKKFIASAIRNRIETKGGLSVKGRLIDKDNVAEIERFIERISTELGLPGVYNIQGFISKEGKVFFTEINPRFAGTHALTIKAGLNSIKHILDLFKGKTAEEIKSGIKLNYDLKMVRFWDEVFINGEEISSWKNLIK